MGYRLIELRLWVLLLGSILLLLGSAACHAQTAAGPANDPRAGPPYPVVAPGVELSFPHDHGAHPDFRTEWWYITGWLEDEDGVERGFQVTFFRVRPRVAEGGESRFNPTQLILAHAAIADPAAGRLIHSERSERLLPPLVGAEEGTTAVRMRDWSLDWTSVAGHTGHYTTRVRAADFDLDLRITATETPVLNGDRGYSRKAPDPDQASYYYSRPQLDVEGQLRLKSAKHAVRGLAWLDHEWSSEILPAGARGWDWIGINLHEGGSLMAFRMRGGDDEPIWAAATLRNADGSVRILQPHELHFEPRRQWQSPRSGVHYPVEWRLVLDAGAGHPRRSFHIRPMMDDQELDSRRSTGAIYWEGAVRLFEDTGQAEEEAGKGYLEMTGYAERLAM